MEIRRATPTDAEAIRKIHEQAFPTVSEAELVERLERDGDAVISLVADDDGIVGHVLLSRMSAQADARELDALGLAPVAVVPERQREGIGSKLIEAAAVEARASGADILFLLGEPDYYARFGFTAEAARPFASPYAGPYFQALVLSQLPPVTSGVAEYARAFAELG